MLFRFRSLAILSALLFFALAVAWIFFPDLMLSNWGVEFSSSTGLVSRRAGALYAGIGVMFFLARSAGPSLARSSLIAGFVTACLILAVLGIFELVAGHASSGILLAAVVEIVLAVAFMFVLRTDSTRKSGS